MKPRASFFFMLLLCAACSRETENQDDYEATILAWDQQHDASLTAADGWLNLIGLFWFEEEINTFGSSEYADLVLKRNDFPDSVGRFTVAGDKVYFESFLDGIEIEGQASKELTLVFDSATNMYPEISYQNFQWSVLQRANRIGLRVRDLEAKEIRDFKGVERYPIKKEWKLEAEFVAYDPGRTIPISNVIGQTTNTPAPGKVRFTYQNQVFELDALDGGADELFLIFADGTSGLDTYGGGRYLYIPRADADNKTFVDFNKAYNPPCVFTPYATCPLPPRQNILPFAIEAGHKMYAYDY